MAQGGTPHYQRELAGEVRDLTLKEIRDVLLDKEYKVFDKAFRQQVVLKLAGNVLPRLNEHTGENGGAIEIKQITGMEITNENTI